MLGDTRLSSFAAEERGEEKPRRGSSFLPVAAKGLKNLAVSNIRKSFALLSNKSGIGSSETPSGSEDGLAPEPSTPMEKALSSDSMRGPVVQEKHPADVGDSPSPQTDGPLTNSPAQLSSSEGEEARRSGELQEPKVEAPAKAEVEVKASPAPVVEDAGADQPVRSPSRSTSSTETLDSVISLAFSSGSAETSTIDELPPAFALKWGSFLDEILAPSKDDRRSQAVPYLPRQPVTRRQPRWEALLGKELVDDAGGEIDRPLSCIPPIISHPAF